MVTKINEQETLSLPQYHQHITQMFTSRDQGNYPDIQLRKQLLKTLKQELLNHKQQLYIACKQDMSKNKVEVDVSEIFPVLLEIRYALKHINKWVKQPLVSG